MTPFRDPFEWQESFGRFLVTIKTGGYCVFDEQPTNGQHLHDYFEVCLVTAGTGSYTYKDTTVPLCPGDVILAKPTELHEIASLDTRDLELVFFSFEIHGGPVDKTESEQEQLIQGIAESPVIHSSGHRRLLGYLQVLSRDLPVNSVMRRSLGTLFIELLSALAPSGQQHEAESVQKSLVHRAIDIIDQNIRKPLTVPELARMVGLSERSLRRYFSQVLQKTVVEVIRERKLNRGSALLLMNFDVGSVGGMLSMDLSHFSREFKKQFGICPRQYQDAYSIRAASTKSTVHRLR